MTSLFNVFSNLLRFRIRPDTNFNWHKFVICDALSPINNQNRLHHNQQRYFTQTYHETLYFMTNFHRQHGRLRTEGDMCLGLLLKQTDEIEKENTS